MPLFNSSRFSNDPYGYVTNQGSHVFDIGFLLLVYGSVFISYELFGTLPHKECIIGTSAVVYFLYELWDQGWNGWDTVEDWWYVNVYGVIAPVTIFHYSEEYNKIYTDPLAPLPFVILYALHKLVGVLLRSGYLKCLKK